MAEPIVKFEVEGLVHLARLSAEGKRKALNAAASIIKQSHKIGYTKEETPDGQKWKGNWPEYKRMKGNSAVLMGSKRKKIDKASKYSAGYEFANVSPHIMRNSLISQLISNDAIEVKYESAVQERAKLHQFGGTSTLVLKAKDKNKPDKKFKLKVPARPHLGIATVSRVGGKSDADHIEQIWSDMVERERKNSLSKTFDLDF